MKKPKFKVGDRVKVVAPGQYYGLKGKIKVIGAIIVQFKDGWSFLEEHQLRKVK